MYVVPNYWNNELIPGVTNVKANPDYTLTLTFANGEVRIFDVKPYLDKGFFRELTELTKFRAVKPYLSAVQWSGGQDFCPDMLYLDSAPVSTDEASGKQKQRQSM